MKRYISLFLSVLMIISTVFCVDFSAFANECDHHFFIKQAVKATCADDGYNIMVCDKCNYTFNDKTTDATENHKYVNGACKVCKKKQDNYEKTVHNMELSVPTVLENIDSTEILYFAFTSADEGLYDFQMDCDTYNSYRIIVNDSTGKKVFEDVGFSRGASNKICKTLPANTQYSVTIKPSTIIGENTRYSLKIGPHEHLYYSFGATSSSCSVQGKEIFQCFQCGDKRVDLFPLDPAKHKNSEALFCEGCGANKSQGEITVDGDPVVVPNVSSKTIMFYSFYAEADGAYQITTNCAKSIFYCALYDDNGNVINNTYYKSHIGYSGISTSFSTTMTEELTGGKTYYVLVYANNDIVGDTNTFTVSTHTHDIYAKYDYPTTCNSDGYKIMRCRGCNYSQRVDGDPATGKHDYVNGVCSVCGTLDESQIQRATIAINEEKTLTSQRTLEKLYFYFTPSESDYYSFAFNSGARLYITGGKYNQRSYDGNAILLDATKEYTLMINSGSIIGDITMLATKHEHDNYIYTTVQPSCQNDGCYKYKCRSCSATYEQTIPHTSDDHQYSNGVCKVCKKEQEGYVPVKEAIAFGEEKVHRTEFGNDKFTYTFTAPKTAYYTFYSDFIPTINNAGGGSLYLYNKDGKVIRGLSGGSKNLEIIQKLTEGTVVVIEVVSYSSADVHTIITEHEHSFNPLVTKPSCNSYGYTKCSCSQCGGYYISDYTNPTEDHVFITNEVESTCVSNGYTECTCAICGLTYTYGYSPADSSKHHFEDGICDECGKVERIDSTATLIIGEKTPMPMAKEGDSAIATFVPDHDGIYKFYLSTGDSFCALIICDKNFTPLGFDIDSSISIYAQLTGGETYYLVSEVLYLDEEWNFYSTVNEHNEHYFYSTSSTATCDEYGYTEYACACGYDRFVSYTEPTGKHKWEKGDVVAPTCGDYGYTEYYCTVCYDTDERDIVPATGNHKYENGICTECDLFEHEPAIKNIASITGEYSTNVKFDDYSTTYSITFTPEKSATYLLQSSGCCDTDVEVRCGDELIDYNDDNGAGENFKLGVDFEAGKTYTILVDVFDIVTDSFDISITEHEHKNIATVIPADCGNDGATVYTCTECYCDTVTDIVDATGDHHFVDGVCTACGMPELPVDVVDIEQNKIYTINPHDSGVLRFVPQESGDYIFTSSGQLDPVGMIMDSSFDLVAMDYDSGFGHNFEVESELIAGETYYLVCNAEYDSYNVCVSKKHKHNYAEVNSVTSACGARGYVDYACSICGAEKTVASQTYHSQHSFVTTLVPPTCTADGYTVKKCQYCGYTYTTDPTQRTEHSFYTKTIDPSCTEDGYTAEECKYCGYIRDKKVITKLGHSYENTVVAPTCTENGYDLRYCVNCGDQIRSNYVGPKHKWGAYTTTKKATYAATGVKTRICSVCKAKSTASIPKLTVSAPASVLLSARSKGFTLKWKKNASANGYYIQYSTDSKFKSGVKSAWVTKNSTVSKTVTKLKSKKKYFVRVRCYKTYNGKKYYSPWVTKSITTKK